MRNLKKVLSLALAMVMLLGMMVVGAGAASFTDDADITHKEAVAVVSGIGVLQGVDDGSSFNPTGTLTRAEAAVVIAKLDLGAAFGNLATTNASTFNDVGTGYGWAKPYIDYCAARGLIAGDGAGNFMPGKNVTGIEFALMVCRVLGYEDDNEGIRQGNWEANAASLARKAGLTIDVTLSSFDGMTRDDMAQVTFNALKADMVEYDGRAITIGDVVIPAGKAESVKIDNEGTKNYAGTNGAGSGIQQLCEAKFAGLTLNTADSDDFGRTASTWTYNKASVYTKAEAADVTITGKVADEAALKKLLPRNTKMAAAADITTTYIGGTGDDVTTLAGIAGLTAPGKLVELYINDDNEIFDIFVTTYTVEKVKAVTEKNDKTTYTFTKTTGSYANDEDATNCVFAGTLEKDDVVTTAKYGSKIYVYPTENFTGSQSAKRTSGDVTTLTIDGEKYVVGSGINNVAAADYTNSDDEATYYVDQHGFIVMAEDVEVAAPEYAMIVDAVGYVDSATLDSETGYTAQVRAVLADGTVEDFNLELKKSTKDDDLFDGAKAGYLYAGKVGLGNTNATNPSFDIATEVAKVKNAYGYTLNDDGEMVLENTIEATSLTSGVAARVTNTAEYKGETSSKNSSNVTALFNSKTVFVLYGVDNKKVTAESPVTGVANLKVDPIASGGLQAIVTGTGARGTASVVFIKGSVAAAKDYVYVKAADNRVGANFEFEGITPDGSNVDVWKTIKSGAITESALYEYDVDSGELGNKVTYTTASATPVKGTVYSIDSAIKDGEMLYVGNTWINISETPVNYIDDSVNEIESGSKLVIVMDNDSASKITGIYVVKSLGNVKADIAKETVKSVVEAENWVNNYTPTGAFTVSGTTITAAGYNKDNMLKGLSDTPRFLGALYNSGSGIDEIVYDNVTYKWDSTLGLAGSNWATGSGDEKTTLVKAIVDDAKAHFGVEGEWKDFEGEIKAQDYTIKLTLNGVDYNYVIKVPAVTVPAPAPEAE